jgi:hypothetical protein
VTHFGRQLLSAQQQIPILLRWRPSKQVSDRLDALGKSANLTPTRRQNDPIGEVAFAYDVAIDAKLASTQKTQRTQAVLARLSQVPLKKRHFLSAESRIPKLLPRY